jgi:alcohol dehydrogenase, propanol-preferring
MATARFSLDALRKGGKLVQVGLFGGELLWPCRSWRRVR